MEKVRKNKTTTPEEEALLDEMYETTDREDAGSFGEAYPNTQD